LIDRVYTSFVSFGLHSDGPGNALCI